MRYQIAWKRPELIGCADRAALHRERGHVTCLQSLIDQVIVADPKGPGQHVDFGTELSFQSLPRFFQLYFYEALILRRLQLLLVLLKVWMPEGV
jgi:hypothetical protein